MAPKKDKESPTKAAASGEKASPAKGSGGKTRAASPSKAVEKSPVKKAKAEEPEVAEGPASATRAKTGDLPASAAARTTANMAAQNMLPQVTITDILLGDHRDTVALLKHFEEVSGAGDKLMMEKLVDAIAIVVRLHSQAEAEVLYPLMDKRMGDKGPEMRKHAFDDHAKLERDLLKALEQRKSGSEELVDTVKKVMEMFMHHMKEEEEQMVPLLIEGMEDAEQIEVAQSFMAAKAKAPLEPQPELAEQMAAA